MSLCSPEVSRDCTGNPAALSVEASNPGTRSAGAVRALSVIARHTGGLTPSIRGPARSIAIRGGSVS